GKIDDSEMASILNRDPQFIERTIENVLKEQNLLGVEDDFDIRKRPYWKELKKQFNTAELNSFIYHWGKIIGQFRGDILHTEEVQILDAIKLQIMMEQCLQR